MGIEMVQTSFNHTAIAVGADMEIIHSFTSKKNYIVCLVTLCIALMILTAFTGAFPVFPWMPFSNMYSGLVVVAFIIILPMISSGKHLVQVGVPLVPGCIAFRSFIWFSVSGGQAGCHQGLQPLDHGPWKPGDGSEIDFHCCCALRPLEHEDCGQHANKLLMLQVLLVFIKITHNHVILPDPVSHDIWDGTHSDESLIIIKPNTPLTRKHFLAIPDGVVSSISALPYVTRKYGKLLVDGSACQHAPYDELDHEVGEGVYSGRVLSHHLDSCSALAITHEGRDRHQQNGEHEQHLHGKQEPHGRGEYLVHAVVVQRDVDEG